MANLLLHDGGISSEVDGRDEQIRELREANEGLSEALRLERGEVNKLRRIVSKFKVAFKPQYDALRALFGELDGIDAEDSPSTPTGKSAKWDAVKQRLAPRLREAIDILQMQGTMKRTQLASALKMDYSNCTKNVVGVLKSQGWIVENGGNLSLKEI